MEATFLDFEPGPDSELDHPAPTQVQLNEAVQPEAAEDPTGFPASL
jgi:hypothetical protein